MPEHNRVWAEINLDNIGSNIREIKNKISKNCKIMSIVKADGYGHGAVEISKVSLFNGADYLGVAICDEGVVLRKNNLYVPILILGFTPFANIYDAISNNLIQTVCSYSQAIDISKIAQKLNKLAKIHIKLDTGMNRLGFYPNNKSIQDIIKILDLPCISFDGIYSHFATSDCPDKSFMYEQNNIYKHFLEKLEFFSINTKNRHIANSAAILDQRSFDYDIVRPGIIMYGLHPSSTISDFDLKPAMSLKTRISFIKHVPAGQSIGYNRSYFTTKKTKIATIPIGYADGYSRSLSNKAKVLVNNCFANIIGNICMDQCMIDVSHIKNLKISDEVILFGAKNEKQITIDEIASLQNTITHEIVTDIGKRVPRIYIKNNTYLKEINYF